MLWQTGGVKQLYIVQFIFVTMILPSQVLFPFTNIRRRALQIRKCSEITASIYIHIYPYVYMYTHTLDHRDINIFANIMLYNVTHSHNITWSFFYTIVFWCVPFFYLEKIKCWHEVNKLTTVISAIFSTRVKISSLRQAMHILSIPNY